MRGSASGTGTEITASSRGRKREGRESLENRCATIDRRLWLPVELSYTFVASAIGRFNRTDYPPTTHRYGVRSIKMAYRIMIRLGVNASDSGSCSSESTGTTSIEPIGSGKKRRTPDRREGWYA